MSQSELAQVFVVARQLWPYPARQTAKRHNVKFHSGKPTAHIDPEPSRKRGLPKYYVWCPKCKKENNGQATM